MELRKIIHIIMFLFLCSGLSANSWDMMGTWETWNDEDRLWSYGTSIVWTFKPCKEHEFEYYDGGMSRMSFSGKWEVTGNVLKVQQGDYIPMWCVYRIIKVNKIYIRLIKVSGEGLDYSGKYRRIR